MRCLLFFTIITLVLPALGNPMPSLVTPFGPSITCYPNWPCGVTDKTTKVPPGGMAFESPGKYIWSNNGQLFVAITKGGNISAIQASPKLLVNVQNNTNFPDITTALTTTHAADFGTDPSKIRVLVSYMVAAHYPNNYPTEEANEWAKQINDTKTWCTNGGFECLKNEGVYDINQAATMTDINDWILGYMTGMGNQPENPLDWEPNTNLNK